MIDYWHKFWHSKGALTLIAGILLGLSYPPFPLPFLTFPAFLLIFRIIDLSTSAREAAYRTYPGFLIWNIIATYWLTLATVAGGVAAILANAAVMTIPVMLQYKIQRSSFAPGLIALFQTACWISFEYLHHHWDLAWPWLTVANAWSNVPELLQYISITGFWGVSFWILFSASLACQVLKRNKRKQPVVLLCAVFLALPLGSLIMQWTQTQTDPENRQEVVVVQPNFDSYESSGGFDSPSEATDHLLLLSDSLRTPDTQLIVWPENAIQSDMTNLDEFEGMPDHTKRLLAQKTKDWNTTIMAGATYFEYYSSDQTPSLPYYDGEDRPFLPFNAALNFLPDQSVQVYRKHNLVPIVERIPFVHFLDAIDIFGWVNWNQIQNYGKGERANPFVVDGTQTPALICYDSVYPSWIRSFVQQDAGYLTIITNDGWWGNTSGHHQHFAYARLRAIEFDRWIVRSANNGISGIITPDGSVEIETPYWQTTAFRYDVPVLTSQTFYARYGDWFPQLMIIVSLGGLIFLFRKKRRMRSK